MLVPHPLETWVSRTGPKKYITGGKEGSPGAPIAGVLARVRPSVEVTYFLGLQIIRYLGGIQMIRRGKSPIDNGQLSCFQSTTVIIAVRIIDLKISRKLLPEY